MAKATNVHGVSELLKLAVRGPLKRVNYISTLGVFEPSSHGRAKVVTEASPIEFERHTNSHGYEASKWVGEKLILMSADRGIPVNIFRLGLVWADSQRGRYDDLQREHRIFKSSLLCGYGIQSYMLGMNPTPVDYVARSIAHLASRPGEDRGIYHVTSTDAAIEDVFERCNESGMTSLRLLPFYDWIQELRHRHQRGLTLPAVPLLDFAFSMSESEFEEYQRDVRSAAFTVSCIRTCRTLQSAGLSAPRVTDYQLRLFVENLYEMDPQLPRSLDFSSHSRTA